MSTPSNVSAVCPYDLCAVDLSDCLICPGCSHPYHRECWEELGGCAVMGCPKMVEVKKAEIAPTYWGMHEKVCPFCRETILVAEVECPFCKSKFEDIRPVTREAVIPKAADPQIAAYRSQAKWLLFFSAIGCTSPLALLFGAFWYSRNRKEIIRLDATTNALAIAGLGIAAIYMIMILVGILVFQVGHPAS
jgi:hypothetical protein